MRHRTAAPHRGQWSRHHGHHGCPSSATSLRGDGAATRPVRAGGCRGAAQQRRCDVDDERLLKLRLGEKKVIRGKRRSIRRIRGLILGRRKSIWPRRCRIGGGQLEFGADPLDGGWNRWVATAMIGCTMEGPCHIGR